MGGRFAVDDDRTIPDTLEAMFQFASGRLAVFGQYEASGNPALPRRARSNSAARKAPSTSTTKVYRGRARARRPVPGAQAPHGTDGGQSGGAGEDDLTVQHARNFLDCIKSRQTPNGRRGDRPPLDHAEPAGQHLAGHRCRLDWDAEKERVTNHEPANALLHYEYRKPWKLE